jgi:hypothetical protein
MIVFERCLSPRRGLSIRERRAEDRGDVGCEASESDDELLETEGDSEGRGGRSPGSGSVIETGAGKGSVAVAGDAAACIGMVVPRSLERIQRAVAVRRGV